ESVTAAAAWDVLMYGCLTEAAGILPDGPLNGYIGGSVMFTTSLTETDGPFSSVNWNVNTTILVINYQSGSPFIPPGYQDRITFFPSTLSLELRDLTLDDGGEYGVNVFPENTKISVSPSLEFYEEGSEVILTSTEQIIEGSSVTLTCEASGSSPSRKWKKDGSDLSLSENVTLSEDNKVLTFRAVNKDNSGEYVCLVSNPVSSSEAKFTPLLLTVNGPENVQIEGKDKINENDQIKLICSAESTPSATFTWRQNGSEIIGSSAEFLKEKAQLSDSGTYMCEALNTVTKAAFTLQVLMLISDFLTISDFFDDPLTSSFKSDPYLIFLFTLYNAETIKRRRSEDYVAVFRPSADLIRTFVIAVVMEARHRRKEALPWALLTGCTGE
uniref:Ig-like domain-containing protein n=1 Tax=Oryzias sinensis TaxID=183150 RepID=A0A8C7X3C8_9TELE